MKHTDKANLAASVRQRLLNLRRERKEDFNLILSQYAIERLLFRLSQSTLVNQFVLKGATLFAVWTGKLHRPTQDIDLLGYGDSSGSALQAIFATICEFPVEADGLFFDATTIQSTEIREGLEYGGQRITLLARLDTATIPVQVDIGFGDVITPGAIWHDYPTLLPFPFPRLRVYPRETVVAEKAHAMVTLDLLNSRMKDFYDLWTLTHLFAFDGIILTRAIEATFAQRKTQLPTTPPTALTAVFAEHPAKVAQWQAFLRRNELTVDGASFAQIIDDLRTFLWPPLQALTTQIPFAAMWTPQTQWHEQA